VKYLIEMLTKIVVYGQKIVSGEEEWVCMPRIHRDNGEKR
jgi:hypothetical protein